MEKCATCKFLVVVSPSQQYHDCRESSPTVVVPAFKDGEGKLAQSRVGKIMTVWPRVSREEIGCGKHQPKHPTPQQLVSTEG